MPDALPGANPPTDDEILSQHQSQGTPAPAAAPAEPAFNPQEFGYKFRNETVFPKDRNEAIELMQFGHSFRTNRPKWEQDRQSLAAYEARKEEYQRYDQLSEALQANPEFRRELENLAQKYKGQPAQAPAPSVPPEFAPVLETVNKLSEWKEQQEQREADAELKRELDALEQAYPQHDWKTDAGEGNLRKRLLAFMQEKRAWDPEVAFSAMMYKTDVQKARFESARKAEEDAAKARKAGVVAPGTSPAPQAGAKPINFRETSYDQLEDIALASIGR